MLLEAEPEPRDSQPSMKFSHSFVVEKADIDELGHVNNVAYLRWVQDIAVAHWRHAATDEMLANFLWVVVRHELDYKKPAFEKDEITATTWVGKWTAATCERSTEINRGDDLLLKARTVWCMLNREKERPARISSELRGKFVY